jgi:hypothetical protein
MQVVLFRYDQSNQGLGRCDALKLLNTLTPANFSSTSGSSGSPGSSESSEESGTSGTLGKIEDACLLGAHALNLLQSGNLVSHVRKSTKLTDLNTIFTLI